MEKRNGVIAIREETIGSLTLLTTSVAGREEGKQKRIMDVTVSISLLISIGGIIASVASAFAIVKTKVGALENEFRELKETMEVQQKDIVRYREDEKIRIALIEKNQEIHNQELTEIKKYIKTTMEVVQEIKEALIKKGYM